MKAHTPTQKNFLYRNGLTIVFMLMFIVSLGAQAGFGMQEHNGELREHGQPPIGFTQYLGSGHFMQATFENWESEFLQMALFVLFTVSLRQKGSSESKPPEDPDRDNKELTPLPHSPAPVRRGGWRLAIYKNSLSLALFMLFAVSYIFHFWGSWVDYQQQQEFNHVQAMSLAAFALSPKFWFESFQNWQSEFLSVGAIVFLSIYLRQHGSSQSKPVNAPHHETE